MFKRISFEEIRTQTRAPVVLEGHRRVAQAQLDSCEKQHKLEMAMQEGYIMEANKEKVREILPYINHKEDCLIYRQNYLEALWDDENAKQECNCGVEALKQKLLDKKEEK